MSEPLQPKVEGTVEFPNNLIAGFWDLRLRIDHLFSSRHMPAVDTLAIDWVVWIDQAKDSDKLCPAREESCEWGCAHYINHDGPHAPIDDEVVFKYGRRVIVEFGENPYSRLRSVSSDDPLERGLEP